MVICSGSSAKTMDLNSTVPLAPLNVRVPKHVLRVRLFFLTNTCSTVSSLIPANSVCTCSKDWPHSAAKSLRETKASFDSSSCYVIDRRFSEFSTSLSDDLGPGQYTYPLAASWQSAAEALANVPKYSVSTILSLSICDCTCFHNACHNFSAVRSYKRRSCYFCLDDSSVCC